jgi:serine/threonine-protein kinase
MFKYSVKRKIKDLPGNVSVFEAVQKDLERPVEIRVLNNFVKKESDEYLRFEREFKTIARLDHPSIIKVYDWGIASDKIYYVAERKPSVGFDEYAASGKLYLSIPDLLDVGSQIASAVAYLHKNSIIHRDITFESINYVENKKSAYISNFSLVKNQNLEDLTAKGVSHFQAGQMLPEKMLNVPVDCRSDIFLFGIFLYHLSTGKNPLYDEAGNPRFLKKNEENFVAPSSLRADLSDSDLDEIILRCIKFDPSQRYQTTQEVVDALVEAESSFKKGKKRKTSAASGDSGIQSQGVLNKNSSNTEPDDAAESSGGSVGETEGRNSGEKAAVKKPILRGRSSAIQSVITQPVSDDPFEKAKVVLVSALGNSSLGDTIQEIDAKLLIGGIAGSCVAILLFFLFLLLI